MSENSENIDPQNNKEKTSKKKKRKWTHRFFLILIVFSLTIDLILYFFATPVFKNYIQQSVLEKTEGLYRIDFDKIRFELGSRHIKMTNFSLSPDTIVYKQLIKRQKNVPAIYDINVHSIELWGTGFYKLLFKRTLKVKKFLINQPVIKLRKLPQTSSKKNETRDFIHQDLYPLANKYFDLLDVRFINIKDGRFKLQLEKDSISSTRHYGAVSVKLFHFYLNEKIFKSSKDLFYSKDIQILINNYRIRLSDKIHNFLAKKIYISTKEQLLKAEKISILPQSNLSKTSATEPNNYYYFNSPKISLRGFDMNKLYFNQDIDIQNIIVESPNVKLLDIQNINRKKNKKKKINKENNSFTPDLYKLIKNSLNSVSVKTIDFNHAEFAFYHNQAVGKPAYRIKDFNISLLDVFLNKNAKSDKSRILYARNIRLNLNDFDAKILNKTHNLHAAQFYLHTDTKSLYVKDLSIHPLKKSGYLAQKVNIDFSNLQLSGTDFYRLVKHKELIISKLVFGKSDINISFRKNKSKKESNIVKLFDKIFLKRFNIHDLQLKKSTFNISEYENDSISQKYAGNIILRMRYLNFLNSGKVNTELKNAFSFYGFQLTLNNYRQQLADRIHILNAGNLYLSNTDSLIELSNFSIHPKIQTYNLLKDYRTANIYDIDISKGSIKGIDLQNFFYNKELYIKEILVNKPNFKKRYFKDISQIADTSLISINDSINHQDTTIVDSIELPKTVNGILSAYFRKLSVDKINIKDAQIKAFDVDSTNNESLNTQSNLSLKLSKLYYDYYADSLNFGKTETEKLFIEANKLYKRILNNNYELKIKNLIFSQKDSSFSMNIVRLFPDKNKADSLFAKHIYTVYSPEISFKGVDINCLSNTNILKLGILNIVHPAISVELNKKNRATKKDSLTKELSLPFKQIITDSIILSKGFFGILDDKNKPDAKILHTGFNIRMSKLIIDSNFFKNPIHVLKNISTTFHLQNFKYQNKNKRFTIDFNNFYVHSDKKLMLIDKLLYYTDKNDTVAHPLETCFIPIIKMANFSYGNLLEKKLIADSLQLFSPFIVIQNRKSKKKINPLEINLYNKTKKIFNKIDLSNISLSNTAVRIKNVGNFHNPVSDYSQINLSVSNLLIDSLHQKDKNKLFNSSDISASMKDYSFKVNNGFYKIDIGEMGFSTGQQTAYLNAISLNPTKSREELAEKAKKEVKLLYVNANRINANKLNFKSLIKDNKIIIGSVDVNDLKLHSYKNKHFPLDSVPRMALPLNKIKELKTYLKIDTININNFYVGIEILGANSVRSGYFDICHINGQITHITNDKKLIDAGLVTKIRADGLIMNEGLLKASFRFPLNSKIGEYYYGGQLSTMDMKSFNPLLEDLYFVSIRDGIIDSILFNVSANDDYSVGNIKFVYNNLKFDIRNKPKADSLRLNKRGFVSMLANSIVKSNNPKHRGGRIRNAKIYYEREIYYSVFRYWTMSLLSGIKTTMGFQSKELKERLKWEKIYEKNKRYLAKKEKKISRKEKRKNQKEINKDLKGDLRRDEKEKQKD